jgi:hypothetical protein
MDLLCSMNDTKKTIDRQEIQNMLNVFIASFPLVHFCANIPTWWNDHGMDVFLKNLENSL